VAEFDRSVEDTNSAFRDHLGARAELDEVSDEVMQLVDLLDGLNRYRYLRDPEMLEMWRSMRRIVTSRVVAEEETPGGSAGEVKPAA
jgi:hypothetical protein